MANLVWVPHKEEMWEIPAVSNCSFKGIIIFFLLMMQPLFSCTFEVPWKQVWFLLRGGLSCCHCSQMKACLLISPKDIRWTNTSLKTCFFSLTLPDQFILFSLKGVFSFSCFPFPGIWLGVVFHRSGILPAISWLSSIPLRWRCLWFLAFSRCSLVSRWVSSTTCKCFALVFSWCREWNVFGCFVV